MTFASKLTSVICILIDLVYKIDPVIENDRVIENALSSKSTASLDFLSRAIGEECFQRIESFATAVGAKSGESFARASQVRFYGVFVT